MNKVNSSLRTFAAFFLGFLALCLCYSGSISRGSSSSSNPPTVTVLDTHFYPTFGNPAKALITDDDAYVLVSVNQPPAPTPCAGSPTPAGTPTENLTGVQVFERPCFTNPCNGRQIINFPPPMIRREAPVKSVYGMQFFPGSPQVSIGAAVEARGAEFFRLSSLNEPCSIDGVRNVPEEPVVANCPGGLCPPGTFDVAVTPDGQYAFVANEYGTLPSPTPPNLLGGGTIGVIKIERDAAGRFTRRTRALHTIYVPGGNTIPGITMSHDGRHLYVTCEGSSDGEEMGEWYRDPTNFRSTQNSVVLCPGCNETDRTHPYGFKRCDNKSNGGGENNGLLVVVDVAKAIAGEPDAITTRIASGCSPVRAVATADDRYVFVAARGRNKLLPTPLGASGYQILAFDAQALVSDTPNDAFLGYGDSGGTGPVGMALFGKNDSLLAVANSNRYYYESVCSAHPEDCTASVAILDVSNPSAPAVQQIIPNPDNPNSSAFPRDVTIGPDGSTIYVPNFNANLLEVITTNAGSPQPQ
jgi:DNA-binding beta-propeller fold protein YncE